MANISIHLDRDNLHHAYLIEGEREVVLPQILEFVAGLGMKVLGNPDLYQVFFDSFKIEDARNLRKDTQEKSASSGKKIFIIYANSFLIEAQNTLLKMFEEPNQDVHFFVITPSKDVLLHTLVSRFYVIKNDDRLNDTKLALEFVSSSLLKRLDMIKSLLTEEDDESIDSPRSVSIKFLDSLEVVLHDKFLGNVSKSVNNVAFFDHMFKVREFLRQPGSSPKTLMESVALTMPNL